ncbi:Mannan endo-1,4-beta-mannosidase protein [Dioscorea alata]|uniref:Mannan endo-1,4-beta-mannosidase protein n=1 Tax=Dioscorea alata TaxID=55571 RepID=A0ACB7VB34_DIOAL|nr:Mannan endo-1,4-beta-mannosidase protein [Dioscorea alata]
MASFGACSCLFACVVLGLSIFTSAQAQARVLLVNGDGFVKIQRNQFVMNGSPFLFNGFNSYWMMHMGVDPAQRGKVSEVFRDAAAAGLSVCRTWAFSDGGYQALQVSPGVYDERVFQSLDFVVSEAKRYGIRLILSLANNFKDFGGKAQYVQWAKDAGQWVSGEDDFFTNTEVKNYYKNHIKKVLTRYNTITKVVYKDDPTIMAWELINEPRCQVDYSGKTVHAWVEEMAAYTKSIDNKHLLEIGMEGFYGDSMPEKKQYNPGYQVGTDFITSNLLHTIDFATIHAYPDVWLSGKSEADQTTFAQRWMWSHWNDASKILKKPIVIAEFGKSDKDPGYSMIARDKYLSTIYSNIYNFAKSSDGTFGGGLVWQLMAEGMQNYYDGYEIILSEHPSTAGLITRQSHAMASLSHMIN